MHRPWQRWLRGGILWCVCVGQSIGAWLSLVERTVRDREVGGSNPLAPTTSLALSFPDVGATQHIGARCSLTTRNRLLRPG